MEYKRFDNRIVGRLNVGEEVLEQLKIISQKENIKLASVSAIGATDYFSTGAYSVMDKEYFKKEFKGVFEITSILGNINTMDDKYYSHLHINCADIKGNVFGGHLNFAYISATLEFFIDIIDGRVDRTKDENTGINLFDFNK